MGVFRDGQMAAHLAAMTADDAGVITAIVLARLALPLLIPLIILAALILDGVDNSLLTHFTSIDPGPNGPYQSFDKRAGASLRPRSRRRRRGVLYHTYRPVRALISPGG
jgi:hypothetical protein